MEIIKAINAIISFISEIVMLGFLAFGGYQSFKTEHIGRWLAAVILPVTVIAIWGYFLAPNNTHRLTQPWLCIAQMTLFGIAAAVAYRYTNHAVIAIFIALAFGSSIFALYAKQ